MKRSPIGPKTYQEALDKARTAQGRRRVRASEKAAQGAVKPRKTGIGSQSARVKSRNHEKEKLEQEFKRICRERDGYQCRWIDEEGIRCGYQDRHIPVHHINERSQRPDLKYEPSNSACICPIHHDEMHHTLKGRLRGKELGLLGGETYEKAQKEK